MNTGENLNSLQTTNPKLFETLVSLPELRVVECFFHVQDMQFHTLWNATAKLQSAGFTADEISQAVKIYLDH